MEDASRTDAPDASRNCDMRATCSAPTVRLRCFAAWADTSPVSTGEETSFSGVFSSPACGGEPAPDLIGGGDPSTLPGEPEGGAVLPLVTIKLSPVARSRRSARNSSHPPLAARRLPIVRSGVRFDQPERQFG